MGLIRISEVKMRTIYYYRYPDDYDDDVRREHSSRLRERQRKAEVSVEGFENSYNLAIFCDSSGWFNHCTVLPAPPRLYLTAQSRGGGHFPVTSERVSDCIYPASIAFSQI